MYYNLSKFFFILLLFILIFYIIKNKDIKFVSEKFNLMGTCGKIQVFSNDVNFASIVIKKAVSRIKNIELLLTKFSPFSDVSILNFNPFLYKNVSYDTYFILNFGEYFSFFTNGFFDMGLGNVLFFSSLDNFVPFVGYSLNFKNFNNSLFKFRKLMVNLIRKNSMIDLGGIGKGYAIDEAINLISDFGIKHLSIEFGGEIKVLGGIPFNSPWIIFFNDNNLKFLKIFNGSIAVSGGYFKKSLNNFLSHHIINPKKLYSKNDYFSIIVIGNKSLICDSLATSSFSMDYLSLSKLKFIFSFYHLNILV